MPNERKKKNEKNYVENSERKKKKKTILQKSEKCVTKINNHACKRNKNKQINCMLIFALYIIRFYKCVYVS